MWYIRCLKMRFILIFVYSEARHNLFKNTCWKAFWNWLKVLFLSWLILILILILVDIVLWLILYCSSPDQTIKNSAWFLLMRCLAAEKYKKTSCTYWFSSQRWLQTFSGIASVTADYANYSLSKLRPFYMSSSINLRF